MYEFIDVNQQAVDNLPAEALKVNGLYLEDQVPGYKTLCVSGREIMAPELKSSEMDFRHGAIYQGKRYPVREITVGYQLIAASNTAYRTAFNKINGLLSAENAQLIFADEPDKYFTGMLSGADDPEPGSNSVTGEMTITCVDPFKRTVETKIVTPVNNQFTLNYGGNWASYPVIHATFSAVCGIFTLTHENGAVLQFSGLSTGDVLLVDCETATIKKNGTAAPLIGAIGNEWDTFFIGVGTNQIAMTADGTMPTVTLEYREVFL
jgi:predicted phage tail component-like protein